MPLSLQVRHQLLRARNPAGEIEPVLVSGPRPLERALGGVGRVQPMSYRFVDNLHSEDIELATLGHQYLRWVREGGSGGDSGGSVEQECAGVGPT